MSLRRALLGGAAACLLVLGAAPAYPDDATQPDVYSARQVAAAMTVTFDMPNFFPVSPLFLGGAGRAVGEMSQSPPQKARAAALDFGDVATTMPGIIELLGGPWPEPLPRDYGRWWIATSAWPERPTEDTMAPVGGGQGAPFTARNLHGHAESGELKVSSQTSFQSFEFLPDTMPKGTVAGYTALISDLRNRLAAIPGVSPAALPTAGGAVVRINHATSSQATGWNDVTLGGTGNTVLDGVELLGGAVKIEHIEATSKGTSDKERGDGEAAGTVTGVSIAGQPVTVSRDGITVQKTAYGQGSAGQIVKAFNDALASNGFSLVFDQKKKADSAAANNVEVGWTGVTFTQTVPGFPPGFSTVYSFNLGAASTTLFRNDASLPSPAVPELGIGPDEGGAGPSPPGAAGDTTSGGPVSSGPAFSAGEGLSPSPTGDTGPALGSDGLRGSSADDSLGYSVESPALTGGSTPAGSAAEAAEPSAGVGLNPGSGTVSTGAGGPENSATVTGELAVSGGPGATNFADGTLRWGVLAAFGLTLALFVATSLARRLVGR